MEVSENRITEIRQILTHFYDHVYLSRHPLLRRCRKDLGGDTSVAVQRLRRTLLQVIDSLRPPDEVGEEDPMWRPYMVLHRRYVLGKDMEEVEHELGLGARQIQREQRRGLEAVAQILAERLHDPEESGEQSDSEASRARNAFSNDIQLVASEQEAFHVGNQLDRARAAIGSLAEAHGVTFLQERDPEIPRIVGSPSALRQLLVLLLSLVVRSGISRTYIIRLRHDRGDVCCSFIPTAKRSPGNGLSAIDLPSAVVALADTQHATIRVNTPTSEGQQSLIDLVMRGAERPRTVLLVEDNADVVALFRRYLVSEGFQCIAVTDSTAARECIAEHRPDAVVLDVMMRKMDGWELLQSVKTDPALRSIPVVVCSVLDEQELAQSLGADAYLRKPVRPAELIECLLALCR